MEKVILNCFIDSRKDKREISRGLAVKMRKEGMSRKKVAELLNMGPDYVTKWYSIYKKEGVAGLKVKHKGSKGYLNSSQREEVVAWLKKQNKWDVESVAKEIKEKYGVVYRSKQSYYALFKAAGLSWKKVQSNNPKKDVEAIAKKQAEIESYLKDNKAEIESGQRLIFF